eukprot:4987380-Prymnesium_polylepis.1
MEAIKKIEAETAQVRLEAQKRVAKKNEQDADFVRKAKDKRDCLLSRVLPEDETEGWKAILAQREEAIVAECNDVLEVWNGTTSMMEKKDIAFSHAGGATLDEAIATHQALRRRLVTLSDELVGGDTAEQHALFKPMLAVLVQSLDESLIDAAEQLSAKMVLLPASPDEFDISSVKVNEFAPLSLTVLLLYEPVRRHYDTPTLSVLLVYDRDEDDKLERHLFHLVPATGNTERHKDTVTSMQRHWEDAVESECSRGDAECICDPKEGFSALIGHLAFVVNDGQGALQYQTSEWAGAGSSAVRERLFLRPSVEQRPSKLGAATVRDELRDMCTEYQRLAGCVFTSLVHWVPGSATRTATDSLQGNLSELKEYLMKVSTRDLAEQLKDTVRQQLGQALPAIEDEKPSATAHISDALQQAGGKARFPMLWHVLQDELNEQGGRQLGLMRHHLTMRRKLGWAILQIGQIACKKAADLNRTPQEKSSNATKVSVRELLEAAAEHERAKEEKGQLSACLEELAKWPRGPLTPQATKEKLALIEKLLGALK